MATDRQQRSGAAAPQHEPRMGCEDRTVQDALDVWVRGLSVDGLNVRECLDRMGTIERWLARLRAAQATLLDRVGRLRPDDSGQDISRYAADEIAADLGWSRAEARHRLGCARALATRLPATYDALDRGLIDWRTADTIRRATDHVSDVETVHAVEKAALGGDPAADTCTQIHSRARRAVLDLDPHADARHRRARGERRVRLVPKDDGMAGLWALLPAEQAVAVHHHLDAVARASATVDDNRSVDQRRADAFCDLLLGHGPHGRLVVRVNVTVPAATVVGGTEPGDVEGCGPIDSSTARRLIAGQLSDDTTWRRLLTDPVTGDVLDVGRRQYRPPAALTDQVVARDRRCVFPGCVQPASRCDIDHTIGWAAGGRTDAANLAPLCAHHHRLKHEGGWALDQPTAGSFVWRSPEGRQYWVGGSRGVGTPTSPGRTDRADRPGSMPGPDRPDVTPIRAG